MLSYVVVLALAAASGANAATTQDCQAAQAFAYNNAGNCAIVAECNAILANTGFSNNGFEANEGAISNDGFVSNDGFANDGFEANTGLDSNDGFLANDGAASNDGYVLDAALCESLSICGEFGADGMFYECPTESAVATTGDFEIEETSTTEAAPAPTSGCASQWIADGFCDEDCNTAEFNYDGGDCVEQTDSN